MIQHINASQWHNTSLYSYTLYSDNPQVLKRIQQAIDDRQAFHPQYVSFKEFYEPFACVIIDTTRQRAFLIRDHFGSAPFYYHHTAHLFCFGSTLPDLLQNIDNPQYNQQQIESTFKSICACDLEYTDQTYYQQIFRVTPGHIAQIDLMCPSKAETSAFWTLAPGTPHIHYATDADYDAHFSALFHEAVTACCSSSPESVGMEFSGGLDTSGILTALHQAKQPAQLFMHVGEIEDERAYGEQLLHQLQVTYPLHSIGAESFDPIFVFNQYKQWFAGGAPYLFYMMAANVHQAVKTQGCKILLSGFGGDECVTSLAPLRHLAQTMSFRHLWEEIRSSTSHSNIRRLLQLWLMKHPQFYLQLKRLQAGHSSLQQSLTAIQFKPYHSLQAREQDWLQGPLSHHIRMRIEYSAVVGRYLGFSYRYPLLYPPLVEFCFALPPAQKRRHGKNRLLMRRYLANRLGSHLFDQHKKCGDISPGTYPHCLSLYSSGQLDHALKDLPFDEIRDYIVQDQLVTSDRHFHIDLLRYMFK